MFEAIDELEFPELYDETIPVLSFFRYLRKLMGAAGYHDLSMRVSGRRDHEKAPTFCTCNTAMLREWQGAGNGKPHHSLRPCRVAQQLVSHHKRHLPPSAFGALIELSTWSCRAGSDEAR